MRHHKLLLALAATLITVVSAHKTNAADSDQAKLDGAFTALKTYDFGTDRKVLNPIDDAVVASYGKTEQRKALEARLVAVLADGVSRDAKDYCCRVLRVIGSADCVPALAALLNNKELSHSARYALQSIPAAEAGKALREAVSKTSGEQKIGVIGSIAARRDADAVAAMAECLNDTDKAIVAAAAHALGAIGTADASKALTGALNTASPEAKPAVADACLECAGRLSTSGDKATAMGVYKTLSAGDLPKHVKLAATRGLLSAAGKKGE
ncbi:MAG TPA: HEAT repeat domain-containing protein [Pirellulales bacterium]|nr:HEAT repeat domain-containing protein [Pirellulales bacterium]